MGMQINKDTDTLSYIIFSLSLSGFWHCGAYIQLNWVFGNCMVVLSYRASRLKNITYNWLTEQIFTISFCHHTRFIYNVGYLHYKFSE